MKQLQQRAELTLVVVSRIEGVRHGTKSKDRLPSTNAGDPPGASVPPGDSRSGPDGYRSRSPNRRPG